MRVYIAWVQENDYETEPFNLGVYSTKEKANQKILDFLNEYSSYEGDRWLALQFYEYEYENNKEKKPYLYGIEGYELDT